MRVSTQRAAGQLARDFGALNYFARSSLRGNRWLLLVPLGVTVAVTVAELWRGRPLDPTLQVSTAEIMGSLMAGFFGANLLDAEFRLAAGECIFAKPYAAWRMLLGRMAASLAAVLCLVLLNDGTLALVGHQHNTVYALAAAIAPSLFLCSAAVALFTASSNVLLAYLGPALLWVWSTIGAPVGLRFDRLYNPLLQISAWSGYLDDPSANTFETLIANNVTLVLVAAALFIWSCRRLRTAVLQ